MTNNGVKCDVCECVHNCECNQCSLQTIEVTHQTGEQNAVSTPHFCKSYQKKSC